MPLFKMAFHARPKGALGSRTLFKEVLRESPTKATAILSLYDEYEHITVQECLLIKEPSAKD